MEDRSTIKLEIKSTQNSLIKKGKEKDAGDEFKLKALAITEDCIKLMEEKTLDKPVQQTILQNLYSKLGKLKPIPEFQNDIKLLQTEGPKLTSYKGYKILDTDNPNDLLLLGTEVDGSCTRVYGDANLCKGLLAYLLDGKNRALVIVGPGNEIVARSLLRLLLDEETGQAVLFQEQIYPANTPDDLRQALQDMAIRRATALNVNLVASESSDGEDMYPNPLVSKGSRAPYEYVDAIGGVHEEGQFTIPANHNPVIYTPPTPSLSLEVH